MLKFLAKPYALRPTTVYQYGGDSDFIDRDSAVCAVLLVLWQTSRAYGSKNDRLIVAFF